MAMIPAHLDKIWETEESIRTPCVVLLEKILGNIINHPENPKFRDLNFLKIRKKFRNCSTAFIYLFDAGFTENVNGTRLVFHQRNWDMIKKAHSSLLKKIENPDFHVPEEIVRADSQPHVIAARKKEKRLDPHAKPVVDADSAGGDGSKTGSPEKGKDKEDGDADPPVPVEYTAEEKEEHGAQDSALADAGLTEDDMDLLAQIRASKETQVMLSSKDMIGMNSAQKQQYIRKKKQEYREEKKKAATRRQIGNEKSRRAGVKAAQEQQRKRKEYEMAKAARARKKEKEDAKLRKQRIRAKIAADKERKRKQKEIAAKKKAEAAEAAKKESQ